MDRSISVITCAYNESATVGTVLKKVLSLDFVTEIVVVDNGSSDDTLQIVTELAGKNNKIKLLKIENNIGLGNGLKMAIRNTTGDIVVRQDADLEYDPMELWNLVEQIINGNADVVYGSRLLVRKAHKVHYFYNLLANKFLSFLTNMVTNLFLSDVETGAKAFKGDIIRAIRVRSNGFEIENELTIKLKKMGCTFYEVPISYYG